MTLNYRAEQAVRVDAVTDDGACRINGVHFCERRKHTLQRAATNGSSPCSPNSTWRVTSRYDTLRHASLCIFVQEKVAACCVALVWQHGATRTSRQARQARHVFRGVATA